MAETATRTVRAAIAEASADLGAAGCDTPRLDAELLLASVLGMGRERLLLDGAAELDHAGAERFTSLVTRRAAREPVAYILGFRHFRRIMVAVDRRVLIPRPETELLVEAALSLPTGARVADVGTGSGAVALALKDERPDLTVVGTDVSEDALSVARGNASRLGLEVSFQRANLLHGVGARFDAVLANLPYVAEGDPLAPEISAYEPRQALFAGADGLELIRRLIAELHDIPFLGLEVGFGQAAAVAGLLRGAGFPSVDVLRDLAGVERVALARL